MSVPVVKTFLYLFLLSTTAHAAVYVNNVSGNDANPGDSPARPLKTLAEGMARLAAVRDDRLVIAGTAVPYYESLPIVHGGSAARPLSIEGNNAVLSGLRELPTAQWRQKNGIYFFPHPKKPPEMPFLVNCGKNVPLGVNKPEQLKPYSHVWSGDGVYFKPENGKRIEDYKLFGTLLPTGVTINNASYIICRNLTCEYFSNDGFNIHGNCQFMLFENIVSRYNGDDGFSVHEDVGVMVRNAHFHDNDYGVDDINMSRSDYYGVISENNRVHGIHFSGGMHSVIDSVIRDNKQGQIKINNGQADRMGIRRDNPMVRGTCYLKNVDLSGSVYGVYAHGTAVMTLLNCRISQTPVGARCDERAVIDMTGVIVQSCPTAIIDTGSENLALDYSIVGIGNYRFKGKVYSSENFDQWRSRCKVGKNVVCKAHEKAFNNDLFVKNNIKIPVGLISQENSGK